eukprot:g25907.t2
MPSSSRSPDLLKVDVDHADCLFMQEALRVLRPKVIHVEYMPQAPPPLEYVQHYQPSLLQVDIHGRGETLLLRERLWKPSAQFIWSEEQLQKKAPMDPVAASVAGKGAQDRWTEGREKHGCMWPRLMTGCSLSAFLLRAEGYALFAAGDEEAVLVREDLQALLGPTPDPLDAWLRGSFCNPWRLTNAPDYAAWGFDFRLLVSQSVNEQREALELLLKDLSSPTCRNLPGSGLKEITPQSSQQLVEIFGQVLSKQLEAVKTQAAQLAAKLPTKGPLSFEQVLKALNQEPSEALRTDWVLWHYMGCSHFPKELPSLPVKVVNERIALLACAASGLVDYATWRSPWDVRSTRLLGVSGSTSGAGTVPH